MEVLPPDRQTRVQQLLKLEELRYSELIGDKRKAFEKRKSELKRRSMQPAGIVLAVLEAWQSYIADLANGLLILGGSWL